MSVQKIDDVPEGIIHLRIGDGKLTVADYQDVIEPAIEAAGGEHLRLLVDIDKIPGMQPSAFAEDLKMGRRHREGWDRIATVGDSDVVRHLSTAFSPVTPGKVRGFRTEERDEALAWLSE